jgi:hypothetical protein
MVHRVQCRCDWCLYEYEGGPKPITAMDRLIERIWKFIFRGGKKVSETDHSPNVNWALVEQMYGPEAKWKQGVLDMNASWYNEALPQDDDLDSGSRDIHPCHDQVDNTKCPCNKAHLLHYKKEPLSYYRNAVWGTKCAIEDLLAFLEHKVMVLKEHLEDQGNEYRELNVRYKHANDLLGSAFRLMSERNEHLPDCAAIDPVKHIRGKADCTCNLHNYSDMITAIDKWLNGR